MPKCPTCGLPLHRLPSQKGFWSIVDEFIGSPPAGTALEVEPATIEAYFDAHPDWPGPLLWSWIHILIDPQSQPSDFKWSVTWAGRRLLFRPK